MKHTALLASAVAMTLAGCSGSDYGNRSPSGLPPASPLDFSTFVITQYSATNETSPPVDVDTRNFVFGDQDNPAAFNSILATAP